MRIFKEWRHICMLTSNDYYWFSTRFKQTSRSWDFTPKANVKVYIYECMQKHCTCPPQGPIYPHAQGFIQYLLFSCVIGYSYPPCKNYGCVSACSFSCALSRSSVTCFIFYHFHERNYLSWYPPPLLFIPAVIPFNLPSDFHGKVMRWRYTIVYTGELSFTNALKRLLNVGEVTKNNWTAVSCRLSPNGIDH